MDDVFRAAVRTGPMVALLACSQWATVAPLHDLATSLPEGASIYYNAFVFGFGPRAYGREPSRTTRSVWRLERRRDEATLTISGEEKGEPPLVLEGRLASDNAGVPRLFQQVNGQHHIRLDCEATEVPVHRRGASLRYRCDREAEREGEWSGKTTPIRAIKCTQPFKGSSIYFFDVGEIVFAQPPVEEVRISCIEFDLGAWLGSGYRVAGGG